MPIYLPGNICCKICPFPEVRKFIFKTVLTIFNNVHNHLLVEMIVITSPLSIRAWAIQMATTSSTSKLASVSMISGTALSALKAWPEKNWMKSWFSDILVLTMMNPNLQYNEEVYQWPHCCSNWVQMGRKLTIRDKSFSAHARYRTGHPEHLDEAHNDPWENLEGSRDN